MPVAEAFVDLSFPLAGISLLNAFGDQRPVQMRNGKWGRTTRSAVNVRGYEALSARDRGGQRPGLRKYIPQAVGNIPNWIVQGLDLVVWVGGTPVQASQSGRVVTVVAVSQGNIFYARAGDTAWTPAVNKTGNSPPLIFTGIVQAASINQKLWYADGSNWIYFDPSDGSVNRWAASAGQLPVDDKNNTPRLIAAWRGRAVLAGLLDFPNQWFMSKVGDPTDWDYTGASSVNQIPGLTVSSTSPIQACAAQNSPVGVVGDVITAVIPYSDDVLIWGGDHTIYQLSGDPMAGGQNDLISESIGIAWGQAWCKGPDGTLYFFSNRTGIYAFMPGQGLPVRISQQIEQLVQAIDTGANVIRLTWDDRFQGFHVFVTPATQAGPSTHFFWEQRTGAWWTDVFANANHSPAATCVYDGNTPGDRVVLLGSWDGYVRAFDATAADDDGTPISSSVLLGPLVTKDMDELLLKYLKAVLGETSGQVSYQVFVGPTAEKATSLPAVASGTWQAGQDLNTLVRRAGHAVYVQLTATNPWAMEKVRASVEALGEVRRRAKKSG
jgi:hypothetical protein